MPLESPHKARGLNVKEAQREVVAGCCAQRTAGVQLQVGERGAGGDLRDELASLGGTGGGGGRECGKLGMLKVWCDEDNVNLKMKRSIATSHGRTTSFLTL